jgi:hypothetical protein
MKSLNALLIASAIAVTGIAPAFAADNSDSPSSRDVLVNQWLATGDATYAQLAGISQKQIKATSQQKIESVTFDVPSND